MGYIRQGLLTTIHWCSQTQAELDWFHDALRIHAVIAQIREGAVMRQLKEMSRLRLFSIVGSLLFAWWFIYYFVSPLGGLAVLSACNEVGGLRVHERIKTDGYLHSGYEGKIGLLRPDCRHCAAQVALQQFAFVDFEQPARRVGEEVRLVQYRLLPETNDNCVGGATFSKPPAGMCVAILALDRKPSDKYRYRSERIWTTWHSVDLDERRRTLIDTTSKRVVAQERYFSFATPWQRAGAFSPSYRCEYLNRLPHGESNFFSAAFELPASLGAGY